MRAADALIIPAVGPKLAPALFEGSRLKLVQVTGAGVDRLDRDTLTQLGIPVANVAGGSNGALAEYAVTSASLLLRRLAWADAELKNGNYAAFRARMVGDNLAGLDGLLVGLVGFGTIGLAVAQAFQRMGCRVCYHDPAPRDAKAGAAIGAQADDARYAARRRRCGQPACAAVAGDAGADRRAGTQVDEAGRGADPGLTRRRGG